MAGPGAQIFVNGFRGGRMPPKDQIQQIRFHTNSFSAEYHEAGMIRVEVITKPGLGGWRGHTNFGFRDESLNATNAFAKEKGPEQMRRYMVNFQGPIAKGKTGLTVSFDGNSSYDSRTIVAQAPAGQQVNSLATVPMDAMNFSARVEQQIGANGQLQAEYSRRQNDRSNLGVGDFDLPERAYATDNSTDTFRVRSTNVIGKKVFSEFRFSVIDSVLSTSSVSTLSRPFASTTRSPPAAPARWAIAAPARSSWRRTSTSRSAASIRCAPACSSRPAGGTAISAPTRSAPIRSPASTRSTLGLPATYTIRIGDPVVDVLAGEGRMVHPG